MKNRLNLEKFKSNQTLIKFNFKNFEPSKNLQSFSQSRLEFILHKYALQTSKCRTEFWFEVNHHQHKVSMRIRLPKRYLHLSASGENMYDCINKMLDKLEVMIRKIKNKQNTSHRRKSLSKRNGLHSIHPSDPVALVS